MKNRRLALFLLLFIYAFQLFAQEVEDVDPMPIKLKGQVLNLDDELPVPFAYILNYRTHAAVTTDEQGRFSMEMLNVDSLAFTLLGFSKMTFHVPANYNEMNTFIVYAKSIRFALPEQKIKGEQAKVNMDGIPMGKKVNIDPQLRGDSYNKKPPVLAAIITPISFLQYYTSKREREKRDTRKAIVTEKKWEILSQFYNKQLVMELTGLSEFQADAFMIYFNGKGVLSQISNDYEVRNAIKEQFKLYREEGN